MEAAMGASVLPKDLVRARGRFQAWRRQRKGGSRIPQTLWGLAVVEAAADRSPSSSPGFVELPAPMMVGKQCLFESDKGGATMRVQLVGYDAAEIEILARSFWNAE
jgi:hypothetical protein